MSSSDGGNNKSLILNVIIIVFLQLFGLAWLSVIPLIVIKKRVSNTSFLLVSASAIVISLLMAFSQQRLGEIGNSFFVIFSLGIVPVLLIIEAVFAEILFDRLNYRRVFSVFISSVVFSTPVLIAFFVLYDKDVFYNGVLEIVNEAKSIFPSDFIDESLSVDLISQGFLTSFVSGFLFFNYFMVLLSIKLGYQFSTKKDEKKPLLLYLLDFRLPDMAVWGFISSVGVFICLKFFDGYNLSLLQISSYAYIFVFLYFLQGIGIIVYYMINNKNARFIILGVLLFSFILNLFFPKFSIIFILSISCFGLSEIWLKYRKD